MWNSAELYEDIQHITSSHDEDFYTALNNDNWVSCNTKTQHNDCDDKLMWKQRRNGHSCYFQAYPGFTKYGQEDFLERIGLTISILSVKLKAKVTGDVCNLNVMEKWIANFVGTGYEQSVDVSQLDTDL